MNIEKCKTHKIKAEDVQVGNILCHFKTAYKDQKIFCKVGSVNKPDLLHVVISDVYGELIKVAHVGDTLEKIVTVK